MCRVPRELCPEGKSPTLARSYIHRKVRVKPESVIVAVLSVRPVSSPMTHHLLKGVISVRGGAHAHAIRPRDYAQLLNRKVRALGMRIALSSKLEMGLLRMVQDLNEGQWGKTTEANRALRNDWVWRGDEVGGPAVARAVVEARRQADVVDASEAVVEEAEAVPAKDVTYETTGVDQPERVIETDTVQDPQAEEVQEIAAEPTPSSSGKWEWITRFGRDSELSILFVHPPEKSADSLWPFARVIRNIPGVEIMSTNEVQVYHVLKFKWLVMEGSAVDAILRQKGQAPVPELDLGVREEGTTFEEVRSVTEVGKEGGGRTKLPKQWHLRKWRHDTGAKSMRAVFGMNNATRMENEAKKAIKDAKKSSKKRLQTA